MLHFKQGVDFFSISPQIVLAMFIADQYNPEKETWITSLHDNTVGRKPNSMHRSGNAVDLRTKSHLAPKIWAAKIRNILSPQYQVIFEHEGKDNEHIHIEYDPRN
jgi:predicted peptidase